MYAPTKMLSALFLSSIAVSPSAANAVDIYTRYFAGVSGGKPCYARYYGPAHLNAHPKQTVRRIARFRPLEQLRSEALTDAVGPRVEMPHLLASPPQKRDDAAVVLGNRHRTGRSGRRTLSKPPSAIPEPPR